MLTNKELEMAKNALRREMLLGNVRIMHRTTPVDPPKAKPVTGRPRRFIGVNPRKLSPEDRLKYDRWKATRGEA